MAATPTRFSFQKLAYLLICLCIVLGVLYAGSSIFIPLTFGMLFAFMLKPLCDRLERITGNRVVAIVVSLIAIVSVIGAVLAFFGLQISSVLAQSDDIAVRLEQAVFDAVNYLGGLFNLTSAEVNRMMNNNINGLIRQPLNLLTTGLTTSGYVIGNVLLTVIYTFFFLLYRTAIRRFAMSQLKPTTRDEGERTMREVQRVASSYLAGMLTVMLVLGVLNSLGLYFIGIQYALLWGFLAALLAVIPYIGTTLGGLLPLLYAIATTGTLWQPVAVVVLYASVQTLEGNFITPKVVGNSVKINALAAVLSLLFGAAFWGLPGLILAIPLLAMVRIVMEHMVATQPIALLLSDDLYDHSDLYVTEYSKPKYRLYNLFKTKRAPVVKKSPAAEITYQVGQPDPEVVTDAEPQ